MPAIDWSRASIHPSRLRERRVPTREVKITPPVKIDVDNVRWLALRTAPQCERRVANDLNDIGFRSYCPCAVKLALWKNGRGKSLRKSSRQVPVFSGYIFVGVSPGQDLRRSTID